MKNDVWDIGDTIEVIESGTLMSGEIVELDLHPLMGDSFAKIRIRNSPAIDAPYVWVNLRRARKVKQGE